MGDHPLRNEVVLRHLFELCPSEQLATYRQVCKSWHELSLRSWRMLTCPKLYYGKDVDLFVRYWDSDFGSTPIAWEEDSDEDDDASSTNDADPANENVDSSDDEEMNIESDEDGLVESDHSDGSNEDEQSEDQDRGPSELGIRNSIQEYINFLEDPSSQYATTPHRSFVLKLWNFNDQRLGRLWTLVGTLTRLLLYKCRFPGAEEFRQVVFNSCPNIEILVVSGGLVLL